MRLLYPVYSVKVAGYADSPEGAFELQRELGEDSHVPIDVAAFVIGEPIDADEVDGLSADLLNAQATSAQDDSDAVGVTSHDIAVVELPDGTEEEDAEDIAVGNALADELDAEDDEELADFIAADEAQVQAEIAQHQAEGDALAKRLDAEEEKLHDRVRDAVDVAFVNEHKAEA